MDDNDIIYDSQDASQDAPARKPYVPKVRPRKTQEAINDLEEDESFAAGFTHDSNVTVGSLNPLSARAYNRSRGGIAQLQRDLHYGQYLEIPKGKRQIFSSRERSAAVRSRAAIAIIMIVLVIIAFFAWQLIAANFAG